MDRLKIKQVLLSILVAGLLVDKQCQYTPHVAKMRVSKIGG